MPAIWRALAAPGGWLTGSGGARPAGAGAAAGREAGRGVIDGLEAWWPQQIRLQTPVLQAMGRRLTGVVLELQRQPGPVEPAWHAQIQADQTVLDAYLGSGAA